MDPCLLDVSAELLSYCLIVVAVFPTFVSLSCLSASKGPSVASTTRHLSSTELDSTSSFFFFPSNLPVLIICLNFSRSFKTLPHAWVCSLAAMLLVNYLKIAAVVHEMSWLIKRKSCKTSDLIYCFCHFNQWFIFHFLKLLTGHQALNTIGLVCTHGNFRGRKISV